MLDENSGTLLTFLDYKMREGNGQISFNATEAKVVIDIVEKIHCSTQIMMRAAGVPAKEYSSTLQSALEAVDKHERAIWAQRNRKTFVAIPGGKK